MSKRDGMVLTVLDVFTLCARECAVQMMQNAIYVQKELPNVQMSGALRRQAGETCDQLIGTKHDPQAMIARILVMESAGNVLNAFNRMQSAADGVLRAVQGCPLAGSSR